VARANEVLTNPSHPSTTSWPSPVAETIVETRVVGHINQRQLDRHAQGWAGVPEGVSTDEGWPLGLSRYADMLTA